MRYNFQVLSFFLILSQICCSSQDISWEERYRQNKQETMVLLSKKEDAIEKEAIALSLLGVFPEESVKLCQLVSTSIGEKTCRRFQYRPHLWTISEQEKPFWNGGTLGERLFFPRRFQVHLTASVDQEIQECQENALCLRTKAEEILYQDWEKGAVLCQALNSKRSQYDCLFHLSEQLPVHLDNYRASVSLCSLAIPYAGECHNHLLIRYASHFWTKQEWHIQLISQFSDIWSEQQYVAELTDVYWSIVAFRVVGMMMPLDVTPFLEWEPAFQPHLRSAVALRVWDQDDPILEAKRAFRREELRLTKARGPNSPRFNLRPLWKNQSSSLVWKRFGDIRGGVRPVHADPEIDLVWAVLTASAMSEPAMISYWETMDKEQWEIRWAMAHLLQQIGKKNTSLFQQLRKDKDHRVVRATR